MPPPLPQTIGFRLGEPYPQFDTFIEWHDVQRIDIGRRADDAFAEAEADCKILQIPRCRHHYRIGPAVVCKRHRRLFRNRTTADARTAISPNLARNDSYRFHHALLHSEASAPRSESPPNSTVAARRNPLN